MASDDKDTKREHVGCVIALILYAMITVFIATIDGVGVFWGIIFPIILLFVLIIIWNAFIRS